jgi:hypothetical protein
LDSCWHLSGHEDADPGTLVDQSATQFGGARVFDTGNEYADDVFQDANIGIQGGQFDKGAAETSVLRSKFLRLHGGIALRNFNALDWWVWNSYFDANDVGITNNLDERGAGNFHAYGNIFKGSKFADLYILNTGQFNFRDNYSTGSTNFLIEKYFYTIRSSSPPETVARAAASIWAIWVR